MKKYNRIPLVALILIFVVPMLLSFFLFHYHQHFHFNTTNHGMFIKPVVALETTPQTWQIAYQPNTCCDEQCKKILFDLHQLKIALGKDTDRVKITLLNQRCSFADAHNLNYLSLNKLQTKKLQASLQKTLAAKIYLIDPIGNIFMYYADTANPMDILRDMKHVLEVSQVG